MLASPPDSIENLPLLNSLFDFLPIPVILYRYEQGIAVHLHVNKKFQELIGYTIEEIPTINEWFEKAFPDVDYQAKLRSQWVAHIDVMSHIGSPFINSLQLYVHCKDKQYRWFQVEAGEWTNSIAVTTFVDIDHFTRQQQHLEQLNTFKDKLFSIISHDLRAPLASLQGVLSLVESGDISSDKLHEVIPVINQQLVAIVTLFETLLSWASKQLAPQQTLPFVFNIGEIVRQNISLLEPQATHKHINISNVHTTPLLVYADRARVDITFRNILSNAIKFTRVGGAISIRYQRKKQVVWVNVLDNGLGMSQPTIEKIMRREVMNAERGTANEKGSGLGLAFCQEIIEAIGGTFKITSALGKGSRVSFSVPLAQTIPKPVLHR